MTAGIQIFDSDRSLRINELRARIPNRLLAALVWRPQNTIRVDDESGEKILKLVGALEDNDDVQNVYANFEISDALMAKLAG